MSLHFASRHRTLLGAAAAVLLALAPGEAAEPGSEALWDAHVAPLLRERCGECHNAIKRKSGLDLGSFQSLLRGGDRGAAVLPGRVEDSLLYQVLQAGGDPHMPPKHQLSADEMTWIRTWIESLPAAAAPVNVPGDDAAGTLASRKADPVWIPPPDLPAPAVVDRFLEIGWRERGLTPAAPADDWTLVRRLHLDLVGRVPSETETAAYMAEEREDRWVRRVEDLMAGPEFARHFAALFDGILMGRRGPEVEERRRKHRWLEFLEACFRTNRPWNEVVGELIRARPSPADRGAEWYLYERKNNAQAMAEALAPVVFGVQIQCAQCHDHLVAREIKQAHYWGLVAAFNRTKNVETPTGPGLSESAIGGFVSFANLRKESQPALMTLFNGRRLEEPWPKEGEKEVDDRSLYLVPPPAETVPIQEPARPKFSRREALAAAVTVDNPLLARAMVNRLWAILMGRGLVHPVDQMDSKHPPSHPDLLDWLAADFERSGYDVRRLVRTLVLTRAYRLDSRVPPGGRLPADAFAAAMEKPLSAEQWSASLHQVLSGVATEGPNPKELRQAFVRMFPDLFAPEYQPTLQQALFLANSPTVDAVLQPAEDNLTARLMRIPDPRERARKAVAAVLGRPAAPEEVREAEAYLKVRSAEQGTRQLLWALVTSAEFQLIH